MLHRALFTAAALSLAGCASEDLPPSVWPPPNFRLQVEELHSDGSRLDVVRRFDVRDDGLVVYCTSSEPLVDAATGTSLPVFDRMAVYQLEPKCVRGLARRLDRLGIATTETGKPVGDELLDGDRVGLAIRWQAFGPEIQLAVQGRLRGQIAEMLAVISGHLPPGERFGVDSERPIVSVLRGVPEPTEDVDGALEALLGLLQRHGDERQRLQHAFALACRSGRRETAEQLLQRWQQLVQQERRSSFEEQGGGPGLEADLLARLLPSGS